MADDFINGPPVIPNPLVVPPNAVTFAHPKLALSALFHCIQNPPINYPTLFALPHGSYIVNLTQTWSNAVLHIVIFKP